MEEKEYAQLRRWVNDLGVNNEQWYTPLFRMIEKDYRAFLSLCEKLYPTMNESQQLVLIGGFSSMIRTDDPVIKQKASQFLRTRLPEMTLAQLMSVVYSLSVFET